MDNQSEISWVLVGVRPVKNEKLEEGVLEKILNKSFSEDKIYHLFLCGTEIDKTGTLHEMEEAFKLLQLEMNEYKEGDFCIISKHEEADLLFLPTILK